MGGLNLVSIFGVPITKTTLKTGNSARDGQKMQPQKEKPEIL